MRECPILFSGPMVRAILDGRKTQTRRMVKPQPPAGCRYEINGAYSHALCLSGEGAAMLCVPPTPRSTDHRLPCPYGAPGDRLWVRETWAPWGDHIEERGEADALADAKRGMPWACIVYGADANGGSVNVKRWRPSIHMPRWASRLLLEVTDVRVERLQATTEADARAEGIDLETLGSIYRLADGTPVARDAFGDLWDEINGKRAAWATNPWVWVVSFRRVYQARARAAATLESQEATP